MKLIDISHVFNENTPIYPGDYKTTLSKYKDMEKDSFCSYLVTSCLHTGTHIDIPMHLLNDQRTAADFPLERFIGKGVLLDVRGENPVPMKPAYEKLISDKSIVLLFTGFDRHYHTEKYFEDHPIISDELADFFILKRVKILGMDMPAPDFPPFTLHKKLLSNDILVLENLTNLRSLPKTGSFEVIALPLKISAEASFVRAICKIEETGDREVI